MLRSRSSFEASSDDLHCLGLLSQTLLLRTIAVMSGRRSRKCSLVRISASMCGTCSCGEFSRYKTPYILTSDVPLRYNICIHGGAGNHLRPQITEDIVSAILKTRASEYNPAVYWSSEEQERRLEAAFQKWAARGVWNVAATKVSLIPSSHSGAPHLC